MICPRRGAQAIHGLGLEHERRREAIEIGELRLVLELREGHVDGVDLGGRHAQGRRHGRIAIAAKAGELRIMRIVRQRAAVSLSDSIVS